MLQEMTDADCVQLFHSHVHPADCVIDALLAGTSIDEQAEAEADARDASEQAERVEPTIGKPKDIAARIAHYQEQLALCQETETPMVAYIG